MSLTVLLGLFWIAFISATLLPAQSELALTAVLLTTDIPAWLTVFIAWLGNTSGSCLNWLIGKYCMHLTCKKWFPISSDSLSKAKKWYRKYGRWSLLLSWMPVIGDPITLFAGILGERFGNFIVLVGASKLARYALIAFLVMYFN